MDDLSTNHSQPDVATAKANEYYRSGRLTEAESLCTSILARYHDHLDSIYLLGLIFLQQGKVLDGERQISRAIQLSPHVANFHFNHGKALQGLERFEEAIASYDRAIALKPDFVEALSNRGNVFSSLKRYNEAIASYDRAIALKPERAHVFYNRGNALVCLRQLDEACSSYSQAIMLKPDFLDAVINRAWTLFKRKRYEEGFSDCERALAISPGDPRAVRTAIAAQLLVCDWDGLERRKHSIACAIKDGACTVHPGDHRSFSDSEEEHLLVAQNWIAIQAHPVANPLWCGELYRHDKIRIAYLSSDFRAHATAHLIAAVFEQHDKNRFEVTALSNYPSDHSKIRERIVSACDRFIDIQDMTDRQVAQLMRAMEIDIAVDLHGFADGSRTGVLAARPAPIQVNYLGYPGTMGARFIDYIIADDVVIPPANQIHYQEKVVYLPHTYQPNDSQRLIPTRESNRTDAGLPESGFVFCCFNNMRKITPPIFDTWMRLLNACPTSVLWLLGDNRDGMNNLRREADARGVVPSRLVFAAHANPDDHLARHRLADLFLDTIPYNAHTTASDALWTGLPVLTCIGNTFSGRVAASLLYAVGLPELVVSSLAEYEALALALARDPDRLSAIKAKLRLNRDTFPLFDTSRYTRNLEAAFAKMWWRHQNNEPPESFSVEEPELRVE